MSIFNRHKDPSTSVFVYFCHKDRGTGICVCVRVFVYLQMLVWTSVSKSKSEPQEHSVADALGAIREHFNHRVTQPQQPLQLTSSRTRKCFGAPASS